MNTSDQDPPIPPPLPTEGEKKHRYIDSSSTLIIKLFIGTTVNIPCNIKETTLDTLFDTILETLSLNDRRNYFILQHPTIELISAIDQEEKTPESKMTINKISDDVSNNVTYNLNHRFNIGNRRKTLEELDIHDGNCLAFLEYQDITVELLTITEDAPVEIEISRMCSVMELKRYIYSKVKILLIRQILILEPSDEMTSAIARFKQGEMKKEDIEELCKLEQNSSHRLADDSVTLFELDVKKRETVLLIELSKDGEFVVDHHHRHSKCSIQ